MSKIYQYLGFAVYIYSNDHFPIHIHARYVGRESKFELVFLGERLHSIRVIKIKRKMPLSENETKEIINFIKNYHHAIREKFTEIITNRQSVKTIVITKRVK